MPPASPPSDTDPAVRFALIAKRLRLRELEQLVTVGGLMGGISALIHYLQRERGISNVYLGSRGKDFADRLTEVVVQAGTAEQVVRRQFEALEQTAETTVFAPRLFGRVAYVLHNLTALTAMRGQIRALQVTPEDATKFFVEVIAGLLAVVFEASDTNTDPLISRALVAMFNFVQGKEFAGQERATAAAGFSAGHFSKAQHDRLLKLIEAQNRSFQIFSQFAEPVLAEAFTQAMVAPERAAFERLRRLALRKQLAGTDGRRWYDAATARMDAMYQVEERLDAQVQALCAAKLAEARADLDQLSLPPSAEPEPPQSVFVIGEVDSTLIADATKTGIEVYSVEGMSPKLGRSLLDLVQIQFRHLQQISGELETARLAINERKIVERAKGLLMTHRNLTEQQAYDLLRKTAMSQNRRMKEVAEAVLAMADILTP